MNKRIFWWVVIVTIAFYALSAQNTAEKTGPAPEVVLTTASQEYSQGSIIDLQIQNNKDTAITFANECPKEPFDVEYYSTAGEWEARTAESEITCSKDETFTIPPKESVTISYNSWNYALFGELGRYRVRAAITDSEGAEKVYESNNFSVAEPSFLTSIWRNGLYRPFYNLLIGLSKYLPGHNLGLAIIIMTIIIRLILLMPSQKALKSQRRMQTIQPKIEAIKKKYHGDQQRIAQETLKLWKEAKVSPFGSCLPLLIQFPILIALFYVVQEGLDPNNVYLLYEPLKGFDIKKIDPNFLGLLDLTKINMFALPLFVGFLQFGQMKLSLPKLKKDKKEKKEGPDMAQMTSTMMYVMPVMIAVFTASLPAGVGLYWAVSTLFGIGQQLTVNKGFKKGGKHHEPENPDGVKIRVIK